MVAFRLLNRVKMSNKRRPVKEAAPVDFATLEQAPPPRSQVVAGLNTGVPGQVFNDQPDPLNPIGPVANGEIYLKTAIAKRDVPIPAVEIRLAGGIRPPARMPTTNRSFSSQLGAPQTSTLNSNTGNGQEVSNGGGTRNKRRS